MTDHLPGLPQGGPSEPINPADEDQNLAIGLLKDAITQWGMLERLAEEQRPPTVLAALVMTSAAEALMDQMGLLAVRLGLLQALEATFPEPTSFVQRKAIKDMLDEIAQARRKISGMASLIVPPGVLD